MIDPSSARPGRLWRSAPVLALGAALLIVLAAFVPTLWQMVVRDTGSAPGSRSPDAPWEATVTPDGALQLFGLRLPGSTLADAQARWGDQLQLALMLPRDGLPALEASVDSARPGGVQGRLIFTATATPAALQRWQQRARKTETVSPQTRKAQLVDSDAVEALGSPITSVGFIPNAQLDETMLRQRFGPPQQIIGADKPIAHWLYPQRGLAVALDSRGRELLQFVPPAEFDERLVAPLRRAPRVAD